MASYSVADAKDRLPRLIDHAIDGAEVVITRHGRPVVELRRVVQPPRSPSTLAAFVARRLRPAPGAPSSVELLRQMYEDDN